MSDRRAVYEHRNDDVPTGTLVLEGATAVAVIAHPLRSQLLTYLGTARTIKELAELLECPVSRLYHHVKRLVEAGLVEPVATRRAGSNAERLYRVAARRIEVAGPGPVGHEDAATDIFRGAALVADDLTGSVAGEELAVLASVVVSLDHEEALAVARRLVALVDEVAELRSRPAAASRRSHVIQIAVSRTERSVGGHVFASTAEGLRRSDREGDARPAGHPKRKRGRQGVGL